MDALHLNVFYCNHTPSGKYESLTNTDLNIRIAQRCCEVQSLSQSNEAQTTSLLMSQPILKLHPELI